MNVCVQTVNLLMVFRNKKLKTFNLENVLQPVNTTVHFASIGTCIINMPWQIEISGNAELVAAELDIWNDFAASCSFRSALEGMMIHNKLSCRVQVENMIKFLQSSEENVIYIYTHFLTLKPHDSANV